MYSAGKPPHSRAATSTVQQLLLFSPSVCVCVHVLAMSTICLSITQSQDVWSKRSAASLDVVVRLGARPAHRVCRLFFSARYQLMGHLSAAWWHALPAETNRIVVHVMTKLQLRRNGRPVMCTVCLSWMQQALFPHSLVWCVVMGTSEPPFASHMKLCKTLTYFYIQGRSVLLLLLFQWLMFTLNASAVSNNEASACAVNLRLLLKLRLISFFPTVGAAWCHNRIAVICGHFEHRSPSHLLLKKVGRFLRVRWKSLKMAPK